MAMMVAMAMLMAKVMAMTMAMLNFLSQGVTGVDAGEARRSDGIVTLVSRRHEKVVMMILITMALMRIVLNDDYDRENIKRWQFLLCP